MSEINSNAHTHSQTAQRFTLFLFEYNRKFEKTEIIGGGQEEKSNLWYFNIFDMWSSSATILIKFSTFFYTFELLKKRWKLRRKKRVGNKEEGRKNVDLV